MAPEACSDAWHGAASLEGADRLVVADRRAARFCVRLALPPGRYVAHLEAHGAASSTGRGSTCRWISRSQPVTLRFDPERRGRSRSTSDDDPIDVVASTEDDGLTAAAAEACR